MAILRMAALGSRRFPVKVTLPPPAMRTWLNFRPVMQYASAPYLAHNNRDGTKAFWGILIPSGTIQRDENLDSWRADNISVPTHWIAAPRRVQESMYNKNWVTPHVRFTSRFLPSRFLEELDAKDQNRHSTILRIRRTMIPFIRDMFKALSRMPYARQVRRWTTVQPERQTLDDAYINGNDWSKPAIVHGLWKTDPIEVSPHGDGYRIHVWWHMPCTPDQAEVYSMNDPRGFDVFEICYDPSTVIKDGEAVPAEPKASKRSAYVSISLVHEIWIARRKEGPQSSLETPMGQMIHHNQSTWALQYAMGQMIKRYVTREKKKGTW